MIKKNEPYNWTTECDKCFHMLKNYLQEAPILRYPDLEAEYTLYTDASKYAYGGVLTQKVEGTNHPVAYTIVAARVNRQPGSTDEGGLHHLHGSEETQIPSGLSKDHPQK